jgi:CO/xanthine dehydrogenase FAD-binding subunit
VKPASFEYYCPRTLDEALVRLDVHGADAKPLAGGQSLIPALNFRLATPAVLIDLNDLHDLSYVTAGTGGLRIGGMTRHRTLERSEVVAREAPLVAAVMPFVAHPAIRVRGTLGGSVAHADPAAELPAAMLALQATFVLRNRHRSREVPAHDFFTGLFSTALEPGELLTEVTIPRLGVRSACAFEEFSRRHGDYALAGAAAVVSLDQQGRCSMARVALLSVGDRPLIAEHVPNVLAGQIPTPEAVRAAADAAAAHDIDPPADIHASSPYRRHLAGVLIRRVLSRAFQSVEAV